MSAPVTTVVLCLVAGLAIGTTGGYFWGVDSQPSALMQPPGARQESLSSNPSSVAAPVTGISAAIQNPTGLRLVGTVVQPERSKSRAWILQAGTDVTQAYGEGDALPGGYRLKSIGAEDLLVTKDGYDFSIRRASSSSGENYNAPCEVAAQAAQTQAPTHAAARRAANARHGAGIFDFSGQNQANRGSQVHSSQSFGGQQNAYGNSAGGGTSGERTNSGINGSTSSSSSSPNAKTSKNWGEKAPVGESEPVRSNAGDVYSTLPASDENP